METIVETPGRSISGHTELTPPREKNLIISIFDSHDDAEVAVKEMQKQGIDIKKLSIIGRDFQTNERVETAIKGKYVIVAHGTPEELLNAKEAFRLSSEKNIEGYHSDSHISLTKRKKKVLKEF